MLYIKFKIPEERTQALVEAGYDVSPLSTRQMYFYFSLFPLKQDLEDFYTILEENHCWWVEVKG
jgi:hypothetical protein